MNSKETLKEKKLRLEEELKEVYAKLDKEDKAVYAMDLLESKIREVQKVFPTLKMEVNSSNFSSKLYLREYSVVNGAVICRRSADLYDVDILLKALDDLLVNTDKYVDRYEKLTELNVKLRLKDAYLLAGTFSYELVEKVPLIDVEQRVKVRGTFDKENKLNIVVDILHVLEDTFTDGYNVNLDGFDFDVEVCGDNLDEVDFYDSYQSELKGIEVDKLPELIDRLKVVVIEHSVVANLKRNISIKQTR